MSDKENDKTIHSNVPLERRAISVDEYALSMMDKNYDEKRTNGKMINGKYQQVTKQRSDDDYVCALLPRTNNRPSAKTCWRRRTAFAPSPNCDFGPKCTLKQAKNKADLVVLQDPSSQRLHWVSTPDHLLIIRKPGQSTLKEFRKIVEDLLRRRVNIYIESTDREYLSFDHNDILKENVARCHDFNTQTNMDQIDLIICLGGDGTLLHVSSIYQKSCPPILSFSMGSLGFLTPFDFKNHESILNEVLAGDIAVLLRTRLKCQLIKDNSSSEDKTKESEETTSLALNEVVIDRGPNSYLSNLDLYVNDRFITKVQGDGLIISTPTGSTAYAMAAGASMVHPNVPCMVICPVCPHSLSFRPIVVPAGIELTVKVSDDSRLTAWLSVDGRNRLELQQQDCVKITTSVYPVPSICRFDQLGDWFESLASILHWNLRKSQLNLDNDQNDDTSNSHDEEEEQKSASDSSIDVYL